MSLRLEMIEQEIEEEERLVEAVKETPEKIHKLAKKFARKYLPKLLVTTDPEYLKWAIENDYTVLKKLAEYKRKAERGELTTRQKGVYKLTKRVLKLLRKFSSFIKPFAEDFLTPEFITESIEETKPELAPILKTPEGRKWLESNIRDIRALLGW